MREGIVVKERELALDRAAESGISGPAGETGPSSAERKRWQAVRPEGAHSQEASVCPQAWSESGSKRPHSKSPGVQPAGLAGETTARVPNMGVAGRGFSLILWAFKVRPM